VWVLALDVVGELDEPLVEVVEKRTQQVVLAVVVVVEGGLALGGLVGDVLHREVRVPVRTERAVRGTHDLLGGVAIAHCEY